MKNIIKWAVTTSNKSTQFDTRKEARNFKRELKVSGVGAVIERQEYAPVSSTIIQ